MSNKENRAFIIILDRYKKELSKSEKKSKKFLVKVGVYTEKGNLRKNYKHLCI